MDTSLYRPDELKVNVMNDTLTVEAKHTEQSDDGRNFISRLKYFSLSWTKMVRYSSEIQRIFLKVKNRNFGEKNEKKNIKGLFFYETSQKI